MSGRIKVTKLDKIGFWFEENKGKVKIFLLVGGSSFVALSCVALTQGIGYEATGNITSIELLVKPRHGEAGHPCLGYIVTGNLTCAFSPFLYPVTHIFGYETNTLFTGLSEPHDSEGKSVMERHEISVAFREFPKNILYYLALSLVVAFGSSKLIERFRRSSEKLTPK